MNSYFMFHTIYIVYLHYVYMYSTCCVSIILYYVRTYVYVLCEYMYLCASMCVTVHAPLSVAASILPGFPCTVPVHLTPISTLNIQFHRPACA